MNSLVYRLQFLIFNMQKGKRLGLYVGLKKFLFVTKTSIKSVIKKKKVYFQSIEINVHWETCLPLHLQIIIECVWHNQNKSQLLLIPAVKKCSLLCQGEETDHPASLEPWRIAVADGFQYPLWSLTVSNICQLQEAKKLQKKDSDDFGEMIAGSWMVSGPLRLAEISNNSEIAKFSASFFEA